MFGEVDFSLVTMATVMTENEKNANLTNSWTVLVKSFTAKQLKVLIQ
jgi:hypothetical protein